MHAETAAHNHSAYNIITVQESTANLAWALEASQHGMEDHLVISRAVRLAVEVRAECRAIRGDLFGAQEDYAALASIGQDTSQVSPCCQPCCHFTGCITSS